MPEWMYPLCIGCGVRHDKDTPCPDGTVWWQGFVVCRICTHRHMAVVPIPPGRPCPPQDTQCSRCEAYACDPEEE